MATHIVVKYSSQNSEILFRAFDGIAIAQQKNAVLVYGEDPNKKQSRVFIDPEHARRFLREKVAADDLKNIPSGGTDVVIEDRDGESILTMPADAMELPGGIRGF